MPKNSVMHELYWLLSAGISGLLMYILPAAFSPMPESHDGLFPWLEAGVEMSGIHTVIFFIAGGFVIGMIRSKRAWLTATGLILPLYAAAVVEMVMNPYSHNLWPIEFLFYGVPGCAAVMTSLIATRIARKTGPAPPSAG